MFHRFFNTTWNFKEMISLYHLFLKAIFCSTRKREKEKTEKKANLPNQQSRT